jgi:hypothetical protein
MDVVFPNPVVFSTSPRVRLIRLDFGPDLAHFAIQYTDPTATGAPVKVASGVVGPAMKTALQNFVLAQLQAAEGQPSGTIA